MTTTTTALADRVDALDWDALGATLDDRGFAITEPLLHPDECDDLAALFDDGRPRCEVYVRRPKCWTQMTLLGCSPGAGESRCDQTAL